MRFVGAPRYIIPDVEVALDPSPQPLDFTYTCHFFTNTGRLIGRSGRRVVVPAGEKGCWTREGWGNDDGGYWRSGTYYAECDADGQFMGGRYFEVERR